MKAKFYAFDNAGNQQSPNPSDITITEDGVPRTVLSVTCPPPTPSRPLSSVLVMDVSGSMSSDAGGKSRISIAQDVARLWVNAMPQGQSECAITSFDDANHLHQDFTANRTKLLSAIQTIGSGGGTDYNMGLLEPLAGGLQISKTGKQQKIIVFLTDGLSDNVKTSEIIAEANRQNCIIYCVTIGLTCPQSLKNISVQTGGEWFEDVVTQAQADDAYKRILYHAQNGLPPCEIMWESGTACSVERNVVFAWSVYSYPTSYHILKTSVAELAFSPKSIFFRSKPIGIRFDTTVTVRAVNAPFDINNITSTNPDYNIYPKSFSLKKGESKDLSISIVPIDSSYGWTKFEIQNDKCEQFYYASGGYPGVLPTKQKIKIDSPNGGEIFVVFSDSIITWSGIPITDSVRLEYSVNGGFIWNLITENATGGKYYWHIPNTPTNQCLVRATHLSNQKSANWVQRIHRNIVNDYEVGNSVAVDSFGNVYATGYFQDSTTMSGIHVSGSIGKIRTPYIIKYSPGGSVLWVRTITESNWSIIKSVAVDGFGNSYITGYFIDTANFDSLSIHTISKSINLLNINGMFVAKYNFQGHIEWVKTAESRKGSIVGNEVSIDYFGNIFVIGDFQDTTIFDGGQKIFSTKDNTRSKCFIAKYHPDGLIEWIKHADGTASSSGYAITSDKLGSIYVTGRYQETFDFDTCTIIGNLHFDFFLAKLLPNGNVEWLVNPMYGDTYSAGLAIAVDRSGSIYITGSYSGALQLGVNSNSLYGSGYSNPFIAKYQNDGTPLWLEGMKIEDHGFGSGIAIDRYDNPCISGSFSGNIDFKGITLYHADSPNAGGDLFIARYKPSGKIDWAIRAGGRDNYDEGYGIAIDPDMNIYSTGLCWGKCDFTQDTTLGLIGYENYTWKIAYQDSSLQSDTSDAVFSIVMPQYVSTDIDMGKVVVAKAKDSVITTFIRNTGTYPFRVDSIWLSGSGAFSLVSGIPPFDVPAGAARQVEFRFRPPTVGMHQAQIVIRTQADTIQQLIRGEGVLPQVQALGEVIDFGQVSLSSIKDTVITVAIQNIGTAPVNFTGDMQLGPDMLQYSVLAGGGAFTLLPNESRTVTLRFAPQFIGRSSGRIGFTHDAPGSPATLTLFGWGIGGEVYIPDDSAAPGEHPKIPILLGGSVTKNYSKLGAVKFKAEVEFNSSLLAPDGVILPSVIDKGRRTLTIETSWDGSSDTLTMIPFIAALGDAETTTMNIPKFEWLDNFGAPITLDIETRSGSFKVSELCREGGTRLISTNGKFLLSEPTPNPSSSYATIHYDLIEEGQTELLMTDVIGRNVRTLFSGEGKPGSYTIRVNTDELPSGKYFYTLRTPTLHTMKMMLVEH